MPLDKQKKTEAIAAARLHDRDSGSSDVQIAMLTERIRHLTGHLKTAPKDFSTRRGSPEDGRTSVSSLLRYLARTDAPRYQALIARLGIRSSRRERCPHNEVTLDIGGKTLTIETGRLALLAAGSAMVRLGDTIVLSGASNGTPREGIDFFPLTIDYREKTYGAGKIPGGFLKRESAPSPREILTMRMTDRPIRPLWPEGFQDDVQIQTFVISYDQQNDPDVLSVISASAALSLSKMPFLGPVGAVRIGMKGDEFVAFPDMETMAKSPLDLIVAGTKTAVTMVEAGAAELSEEVMLEAIFFGHEVIQRICEAIEELRKKTGWSPIAFTPKPDQPRGDRRRREGLAGRAQDGAPPADEARAPGRDQGGQQGHQGRAGRPGEEGPGRGQVLAQGRLGGAIHEVERDAHPRTPRCPASAWTAAA